MSLAAEAGIALAVLLGNGFFVAAEFALVSARRSNIELEALSGSTGGSRSAKLTLKAMEQVSLMLAGAQLGVTLCSLIFGAVGEPLAAHLLATPLHGLGLSDHLLHPISFAVALTSMVYLHVFIGEMVPKNLSLANSTRAALLLVPPLWFSVLATKPLVVALNAAANTVVRWLGIRPRQEVRSSFSRDEVAGFVKESHREGLLSSEEEQLLSGTLDFDERRIRHIILPMDTVVTTSAEPTRDEVEQLTVRTGFSRFPVPGTNGSLAGYVHVKDMLQIADKDHGAALPKTYIRPLGSIRSRSTLNAALSSMQETNSHIAQVIGYGGKVEGLLMLEDVLEELVGTIRDETRRVQ